jgi:hypothetical protein
MFNYIKSLLIISFFIACSQNANSFDLKSLTDKLQKDLGNKLQIPKGGSNSGSSNPLGGLMKNLNTNKGGSSINMGSMSQSSSGGGDLKKAKAVCEPNIPQILKNLPKGNVSSLSADFNNKSSEEISNILKTSPVSPDKFVKSLNVYDGAFETKEVEKIFSAFLNTGSIDNLATLKALSKIDPGFGKDKKQIKADATFAYGLIHYFYSAKGANKQLGVNLIKQSAGTPNNIGALTLYGAWQFYGINVSENVQSGNANALEGYNRATEKNGERLVMGPFYQMKEIKYPETVFLAIAGNNKNPYKQQYQGQLARASQVNQDVMNSLKKSEKYDQKSGWWPSIVAQQNRQHSIVTKLGDNIGLAKKLKPLKAKYEVLKTKISQDPTNAKTVEQMVFINQQLVDIVGKSFGSADEVDQEGKKQIKVLARDNELLILKNQSLGLGVGAAAIAQGGFSSGFFELMQLTDIIGTSRISACRIYTAVNTYGQRTSIEFAKPLSAKDENQGFDSEDD